MHTEVHTMRKEIRELKSLLITRQALTPISRNQK